MVQDSKERKQVILSYCIYRSSYCSFGVGDFLLLSLRFLHRLSVSQMFFLDAPFTLLCFQQLQTLYVHALFLLLK